MQVKNKCKTPVRMIACLLAPAVRKRGIEGSSSANARRRASGPWRSGIRQEGLGAVRLTKSATKIFECLNLVEMGMRAHGSAVPALNDPCTVAVSRPQHEELKVSHSARSCRSSSVPFPASKSHAMERCRSCRIASRLVFALRLARRGLNCMQHRRRTLLLTLHA